MTVYFVFDHLIQVFPHLLYTSFICHDRSYRGEENTPLCDCGQTKITHVSIKYSTVSYIKHKNSSVTLAYLQIIMINQSKTEIHGLNKTTVREMADWCWECHVTRGVWGEGGCCLATGLGVKVPCKLFERSQNTSLLVVDEINNCSVLPCLILLFGITLVVLNLSLGTAQTIRRVNLIILLLKNITAFHFRFWTRCLATNSVAESNMR